MTVQISSVLLREREKKMLRLVNFSSDFVISLEPPYECIIMGV